MKLSMHLAGTDAVDQIMTVMDGAFEPRFGESWTAAQVLGSMRTTDAWARLALFDAGGERQVVGFSLCRRAGVEAELLLVGVVPAARGQGVGASLLALAKADATRHQVTAMFLEVRDGNHAAQALYRANGFRIVGRRRDYYRGAGAERFDAVTMKCDLDTPNH